MRFSNAENFRKLTLTVICRFRRLNKVLPSSELARSTRTSLGGVLFAHEVRLVYECALDYTEVHEFLSANDVLNSYYAVPAVPRFLMYYRHANFRGTEVFCPQ